MAGNSFGTLFRLSTYGESHGLALGGIIDGCPAGLAVDPDFIQKELDRRKPGQSKITTQRNEADEVQFLSGIFEGKTTGTPIGFVIYNQDQKPKDYEHIKDSFRPSHADYTYYKKYGNRDYRGGGRASARETVCRIVAGAFAKLYLKEYGISFHGYVSAAGKIKLDKNYTELDLSLTEENIVRCPDPQLAEEMISHIEEVRKSGDTVGGVVTAIIKGLPVGLGEPVFDKIHADLAKAMLSINAVKGFEYGSGFSGSAMRGSEHNDSFETGEGGIKTKTNYSGGVQGGISNGEDIYFNVAFKPVATVMREQESVNKKEESIAIKGKGRHDPCVVPRAVPIVEAMAAIVIMDHFLRNRTQNR